ncbi:MAG: pirin family protein [Flavobacteriaceae bacterium]
MKTVIHKASTRGYVNHGWLESNHTFSFGNYYHPERMNFGVLRVLNDDIVQPGMGFGTHPHRDMEIISIPLQGALSHKDSMDNKRAIEVGEVQVMSAGTGLTHSEFNDSKTDKVNFLQLWILPEEKGVVPNYEQKLFDISERKNNFQTVVSPQDKLVEGSLGIHQQAYIQIGNFEAENTTSYNIPENNGVYIFNLRGIVKVNGHELRKRDAIGVWDTSQVKIDIIEGSELLLIEVPMQV